jgi:hypothetical protein
MKLYGHLLRMYGRWPKKVYQWTLHCRRQSGRLQQPWKNEVTDFMRSRKMEENMVEDRQTSLAFGSEWMALGCIVPYKKIFKIC